MNKMKSHPGVAAVLSFVFSGLGQIYNGQIKKGLALIAATTAGVLLVLLGAVALGVSLYMGFFSYKAFIVSGLFMLAGGIIVCWTGIYSIWDAYKGACGDEDSDKC